VVHYETADAATGRVLWTFSVQSEDQAPWLTDWSSALGIRWIAWRSESGDEHVERYALEPDGNALAWEVHFPERGTEYQVVRHPDLLAISGMIEGEPVDEEFVVDGDPVFPSVGVGLGAFVRSSAPRLEFWIFREGSRSVVHMDASVDRVESLAIEGRAVPAVLVQLSPTGWRGMFYTRRFWFRASDGVLLRTDERDGVITALSGEDRPPGIEQEHPRHPLRIR
jgi:hypothetical protein